MYICTMCIHCPQQPEEGVGAPENGVKMVVRQNFNYFSLLP